MHLFNTKLTNWLKPMPIKKFLKTKIIILIIGIIYLIWYRLTHIGIPCIFLLVTGLYCPGCGITRMFSAISHFDFIGAFRSNCFVFILLPYGIFAYVRHNANFIIKGEPYKYKKFHKYLLNVILVMASIFGVVRNIPYFYFLRPYIF